MKTFTFTLNVPTFPKTQQRVAKTAKQAAERYRELRFQYHLKRIDSHRDQALKLI